MTGIWREITYAFRSLTRPWDRLATCMLVVIMALGIAASTSVFEIVDALLIRSLPFPDAGHLVNVELTSMHNYRHGLFRSVATFALYQAWRKGAAQIIDLAGFQTEEPVLTGLGPTRTVEAVGITPNMISLLGVRPLVGRDFVSTDDARGAQPTALLSYRFWREYLGGDSSVLERRLNLNERDYRIIGIMPRGLRVPLSIDSTIQDRPEVWIPIHAAQELGVSVDEKTFPLEVIGRVHLGMPVASVEARLNAITKAVYDGAPGLGTADSDSNTITEVNSIQGVSTAFVRTPLLLIAAVVVLLLLLACFNAANVVMARAIGRQREIATRVALGASRSRLALQWFAEGVAISVLGWILGTALAFLAANMAVKLGATVLPNAALITFNTRVLVVSFCLAITCGVTAGAWPAATAFHWSPVDALTSRASGNRRTRGRMRMLVALEIALSVIVLTASGLLSFSFLRLIHFDRGYAVKKVVLASVSLPHRTYGTVVDRRAFRVRLLSDLQGKAEFVFPAVAFPAPGVPVFRPGMAWDGDRPPGTAGMTMSISGVDGEYFRALEIPILRGSEPNFRTNPDAVAIDPTAARIVFGHDDPLGRRISWKLGRDRHDGVVVGITGDVQNLFSNAETGTRYRRAVPHLYVPAAKDDWATIFVLAQARNDSTRALAQLENTIAQIDSRIPVEARTMEELVSAQLAQERFLVVIIVIFAGLTVVLAGGGVFAVVADSTAQRTHEIAVRLAVGAQPFSVVRMILSESLSVVGIGAAVGVLTALALSRALGSVVFEISPSDPIMIIGAVLLCSLISMLASIAPALRAANIDAVSRLLAGDQ